MNKKFVMLGERNPKGRIVKNESYSIDEFVDDAFGDDVQDVPEMPKYNSFDKLFKTKKYIDYLDWDHDRYIDDNFMLMKNIAKECILELIDLDDFGKKVKK